MAEKKKYHETVAENLIQQLKEGTAPWQVPWQKSSSAGLLAMNPTTGKRYRGINAITLMSSGHNDPRWLTYKQALEHDAQVRKGEKGTLIQYWKFHDEHTERDASGRPVLDAQGKSKKLKSELERPRVFFATVFNAEQIEGLPPLQPPSPPTWDPNERAEAILAGSGAKIQHGAQNAFYRVSTDSIHLPEKGSFPSIDGYYSTALHELGHWTGHASRLNRDLAHAFGSEGYAKEELRAEIASMIVGKELGVGHDPGQHAAYVASWIKALQDDPLEIFRAAADAEKIQDYVLSFDREREKSRNIEEPSADREPPASLSITAATPHAIKLGNAQEDKNLLADSAIPIARTETMAGQSASQRMQEIPLTGGRNGPGLAAWDIETDDRREKMAEKSVSARVERALSFIPADDRETWVKMAFAVKSSLGEEGFSSWNRWSQTAGNYNERAAIATWKSAQAGEVSVGTLYYEAAKYGFDPKQYPDTERARGVAPQSQTALASHAPQNTEAAKKEGAQREEHAAVLAKRVYAAADAKVVIDNPYLSKKLVSADSTDKGLRELDATKLHSLLGYKPQSDGIPLSGHCVVVPVGNQTGLTTLEFIDEQGRKSALYGGKKSGCWYEANPGKYSPESSIYVAEGVATALSISRVLPNSRVVAALSDTNIKNVALALRAENPAQAIVICADTNSVPKAQAAAKAVAGEYMAPKFARGSDVQKQTDFNDLYVDLKKRGVSDPAAMEIMAVQLTQRKAVEAKIAESETSNDGWWGKGEKPRSAVKDEKDIDLYFELYPQNAKRDYQYHLQKGEKIHAYAEMKLNELLRQEKEMNLQSLEKMPSQDGRNGPGLATRVIETDDRRIKMEQATTASKEEKGVKQVEADRAASNSAWKKVGDPLYGIKDVPTEIRDLAKTQFGARTNIYPPKENASYQGEVYNTEKYLIQEIGNRSVVVHDKSKLEYVANKTEWADENKRLNGAELAVYYTGDKAKVYPFDRQRNDFDRIVASLGKSAKELGVGEQALPMLEQLKEKSWERIKGYRKGALEQKQERVQAPIKAQPEMSAPKR